MKTPNLMQFLERINPKRKRGRATSYVARCRNTKVILRSFPVPAVEYATTSYLHDCTNNCRHPSRKNPNAKTREKKERTDHSGPTTTILTAKLRSEHRLGGARQVDRVRRAASQPLLRQLVQDVQQTDEVRTVVRPERPAEHQDVLGRQQESLRQVRRAESACKEELTCGRRELVSETRSYIREQTGSGRRSFKHYN